MNNDNHFGKIFWYLVGWSIFVAGYTVAITFIPMPKGHERFADSSLSFFLGTVIGGGAFGYLTGRSVSSKPQTGTGTTTADISATIVTNNDQTDNRNSINNNKNQ